ncbi:MAG: hypothetical protein JRN62_05955 [Nitrososphaerota archaeon]|nr:hypothetical protein [Nitrososphaerota archaeon]
MNMSAVDWLLEESQPSVRYLALTELLEKPKSDPDAKAAKRVITERGWAKKILERQTSGGLWIDSENLYSGPMKKAWIGEENLYFPKYISTNWMMLILSDLGLNRDDPRIEKACQIWMKRFGMKDGGFNDEPRDRVGHLCLTGNTARALVKFGYTDDTVVRRAFEWLVKSQRESGG